jgi:hypothetical protein
MQRSTQVSALPSLGHPFVEIEKCADSSRTSYEVLIEETDPALVTMQIDIGWVFRTGRLAIACSISATRQVRGDAMAPRGNWL